MQVVCCLGVVWLSVEVPEVSSKHHLSDVASKNVGGQIAFLFLETSSRGSQFSHSTQLYIIFIQHNSALRSRGGGKP